MTLRSTLQVAVFVVAVAVAGLAVFGVVRELPAFWDPCHSWGQGGDGSNGTTSFTLAPDDDCPRKSGTSETRLGAGTRMALVYGTTIVAGALAAVGAWSRRALPALVAGILMFGETVLLFFGLSIAFPLALAASILFLVAARRWRKPRPTVSDEL